MIKFMLLILSSCGLYYLARYLEKFIQTQNSGPLFFKNIKDSCNSSDIEPISNQEFEYKFEYLDIDNTNFINNSLCCKPYSFGYSQKEGKMVFPDFTYPECSQVTNVSKSLLSIDRESNTLELNCEKNQEGYFFSGPYPEKSLMKRSNTYKIEFNTYTNTTNASSIEYGLGCCLTPKKKRLLNSTPIEIENNSEKCQHASMRPIFKQKLFDRNKKFVEDKPKIVFLLTLDSFSRRHFYRKLPSVVSFLNQSEQIIPDIALFDFQIHSTFGSDSVHNQVPIFAGKDYKNQSYKNLKDKFGNYAMWSNFKKKGYVTVMGFDDCDYWFPDVLGENPQFDYSIRQFYCLVDQYTGVKTEKKNIEQRCVGPYQTHAYALNYTLELVKMYKGVNMWIYLHLNAAHEKTGQHAATLDKDLTFFLERFFKETDSEVLMFLGADHGMRYGNWYNSLDSYQETKLPSMFVLASKSLLDKYPYSYHALSENSKRLTSKLDIRETILTLIDKNENKPYSVNWLTTIASFKRNCHDLESNILFCACSQIVEIANYNSATKDMIEKIRETVEKIINYETYLFKKYPPGRYCDKVFLDEIRKFYHMSVDSETEIFKLEFGSSLFKQLKLEVNVMISSKFEYAGENSHSIHSTFNYYINGYNYLAKVKII